MVFLSRLFPASRIAQNASRIPGRRRPKASPRATPTAARAPSLAAEPLERRAMLAVTASLVGGDLVIAYNEPGDLMADISSDGTIYTVSGTGLAATKFNVADVTGVITVRDDAAIFGQEFKVLAGTALANAIQVNANVEIASLAGGISATKAGDVLIGSAAITLASDISTAATSANIAFTGPVTLTNGVSVSTGAAAGNILFSSTLDGAKTLDLTAGTGSITFTGAVGGGTRLGAISIASATNVLANAITAASLSQAAGSGTTSLNGGVNTNTATGVSLTGTNLAVNAGITTTNSGNVTFNQSGTAAIAVLGDISADGAVSVTAAGGITAAGDVTTTDDDVTFASRTTLTGPVAVSTGAAAGNILFSSTIDGARTLDLTAGTGNVTFTGAVGGGTPLAGISLTSAESVTSASTLSLDGTPALATDGITIAAGVNNVSLTKDGSTIQNFSANGIWFKGGSAESTIGGFTIKANGGDGVRLDAGGYSGTTISANSISGNDGNGVRLTAATGPVSIADNLQIDLNSLNGVYAENSTTVSIVGNSIGGNKNHGVSVFGGGGVIDGNGIVDNVFNGVLLAGGYDVTGNLIENNGLNGIQVDAGTYTDTVIQGNGIYQNALNGIFLNADSGTISGLLVGAGTTGAATLGNAIYQNTEDGILVGTGTYTGTVIGGRNEITLNTQNGIELAAGGATNLLITGNKIGTLTAGSGATDRGNVLDGIQVNAGGYAGTSIEGNWIAFNDVDGIHLAAAGSAITGLSITGNSIYTNDSDGIQADNGDYTSTNIRLQNLVFNNVFEGIYLAASGDSITNLTIGGDKTAIPTSEGNDIRTNKSDGIQADAGNYAGTVIQGNDLYENSENGIFLNATADLAGLLIGGAQVKYGNEIYGNFESGVVVTGSSGGTTKFTGTKLLSNEIRTSAASGVFLTDAKAPAEADGLLIGLNTVTANVAGGIALDTSTGHRIIGNTVTGSAAPSAVDGISLADRSDANVVYSNVVNANGGNGIVVDSSDGVEVGGVIGGFTTTAGGTVLTIAGDQTALILPGMQVGLAPPVLDPPLGVLRTVVAVSLVGGATQVTVSAPMDLTSPSGTLGGSNTADGNGGDGIVAENSFPALIVGNVATGNAGAGIAVSGGGGTIAGNVAAGNGSGIALGGGYGVSSNNVYSNAGDGILVASGLTDLPINNNWIYDNGSNGIYFTGGVTGFSVFRNDIGQAPDEASVGNGAYGVRFDAGIYTGTRLFDNQETTGVEGGKIAYNTLDGIFLNAASTSAGAITGLTIGGTQDDGNSIHDNGANGILVSAGDYAGTTIAGNTIRDNGNPTTYEGNGILVEGSNLMIGWTATAGGPNTVANTITGNAANGIEIRGAAAEQNTILSNSIFLNGYTAAGMVVGDGIALVDAGNGALPSPRILGAVADAASDTIRVQVVVPAAGSYYVQLFANTAVDERGLVPVDVNGFEGRSYVGDSPAQSGSPVTTGKPAIAGTPIAGNTVAVIEMPADRVPAGGWLTATATAVEAGVAGATSGFSAAMQLPNAPVLAVGSDGPAVWVPHYDYQALSGNVLRLGGLTVTEVNRLVAMRGRQIFISANGRSEVATATVANVRRIGGRAVNMVLRNITSPEGSLAGTAGRLEPGPLTLPTARLYDAATGDVVLDVGAEAIAASLEAAGVAPVAAAAFTSRFQGGLRVASGDVDGDGFAELVTASGAAPAIPAATFGNATRIITIYNGNPAAAWESASLDVTAAFPGYSGGFQVTLGDVLPDAAGEGSGVVELIVAGTNKVAVYELTIPEPGAAPEIATMPAAEWAIGQRFRITGLAAGDFSAAASDEVVVATAGPAGTVVRTFSVADGSFAAQSTFRARSYVEGTPQRRLRDVFARGAALAVGDIDGAIDGKPELVLAAAAQGLANFRVLANDLVTGGTQRAIDTALAVGNGFTQQSRSQYAVVNGRRVWQPAGGPDYFAGMSRLTNAFALGINAPLSVAVVNATGATAAGQVFAALGPQNATSNMIRRLAWSSLEASWSGTDAFQAQPNGRTRFPIGGGLLLG